MNNGVKDKSNRTSALYQLLSPDGYYSYLGLEKPVMKFGTRFSLDHHHHDDDQNDDELKSMIELIHKNYRKLSLKHHPDRKGGDAETFRVLARARKVLTTPKLRREYDLLGLDLDDDEVGEEHQQHHDNSPDTNTSTTSPIMKGNNESPTSEPQDSTGSSKKDTSSGGGGGTTNDSVLSAVASATLASLIQMMVRTAIMAIVSTLVSRYTILLFLAAVLLLIILVRVHQNKGGKKEFAILISIFSGIFLMYYGRNHDYYWIFWFGQFFLFRSKIFPHFLYLLKINSPPFFVVSYRSLHSNYGCFQGETLTMSIFICNSFLLTTTRAIAGASIGSAIVAFFLHGKLWRYVMVEVFFGVLLILAALVFPILEMILEEIIRDKMSKVGEKIRAHSLRIEEEMKRLGVLSSSSPHVVEKQSSI